MILVVAAGRKLKVPVIYNLHGSRVCCYWKGAIACCTTCKPIGHFADGCNSRFSTLAEKRDAETELPVEPLTNKQKAAVKSKAATPTEPTVPTENAVASSSTMVTEKEVVTEVRVSPPSTTILPPPTIPPAKNISAKTMVQAVEKVKTAYLKSGHAAADASPVASGSNSEEGWRTVRNGRGRRPSITSSRDRTPTPTGNKRPHNIAITPSKGQANKRPRMNLKEMQSGKPNKQRKIWTGWQIAAAMKQTLEWV